MGLAGKLAKKAATAAGNKAKHKINGGCPGSSSGKHAFKSSMVGEKGKPKVRVIYCHNAKCGLVKQ
jgi:hypothetical protein